MFDDFQAYEPLRLGGVVDVIAEAHVGHTSQKAWIMPGGMVEIAFFLDGAHIDAFYMGDDDLCERGSRTSFSLLFSAATKPQVVVTPHARVIIVLMAPIAARLLFGLPASELHNRTIEPTMITGDLAMIEDRLNTLPSFSARAQFLENYFLKRLRGQPKIPPFVSFTRHAQQFFREGDAFWMSKTLVDRSGYSEAHMNRLAKEWLGTTLHRYESLFRFRDALTLLQCEDVNMARVAADCGYHDQAHFTHRFKQHSGLTPSEYIRASKVGTDTLIYDDLPA